MSGSYGAGPTPDAGPARVASAVRLTAAQAEAVRGARLLLRQHERADLAELLSDRLRARSGAPVVAVVGEAKHGKSTLVNALIGRRGVVPTGTDITTGVFVEVHPTEPAGSATVTFADGTTRDVPEAEIGRWVAVGAPRPEEQPDPVGVQLRVDTGRLPGVVLVDTPGAGGLVGGHARLALQTCRRAALLVFVTDAGQPLSAPELAFLVDAGRSVERVVVAVSKIDKYPDHERVIANVRTLLARHTPRFAGDPVIGVSAELALQAATTTGELAAELDEFSGIRQLVAAIERALSDRDALAVRNVLRTAQHGLDELAVELDRAMTAARGTPGAGAAAERERAELVELRERQHTWSLYLDRDLRTARATVVDRLGRDADRLRDAWRERSDRVRVGYSRAIAEQLTGALRADLAALAGATALGVRDAVLAVAEPLLGGDTAESMLPPAALGDVADRGRAAPAGLRKLLDPSLLLVANSAGVAGAGAMVHAGWIGAAAGGPPAWALGLVGLPALALISLYRQGHAAQRRLAEWAVEEINRVRVAAVGAVDDLLNQLKPEIVIAYRALLTARIAALDKIVKEAQDAARSDAAARQRRTGELELQLAAVQAQQEAVADLLK